MHSKKFFRSMLGWFLLCLATSVWASPGHSLLELSCADPERVWQGDWLTISCQLEVTHRGDATLRDLVLTLTDADGADVGGTEFRFGEIGARQQLKHKETFTFSFDTASQEPPRILWEARFRDQEKRGRSQQLTF